MGMKRNLTCIVCPIGCSIEAEVEGKNVISIRGNSCPRGAAYAKSECTNPTRTVTSTIRCDNGSVLPVKTDTPIDKDKIFDCMKVINDFVVRLPISRGDIIIKDVYGSNVIATKSMQN